MQELQLLSDKLDLLLKKYTAIQAENKRLKTTVARQLQSIEQLNGQLSRLEQNMMAKNIGSSLTTVEDKDNMRRQLDSVISDIDKILNTLND